MRVRSILAAFPICAGLLVAQTSGTDLNQSTPGQNGNDMKRTTQGQTLSGILVASGCDSSSMNGAWSGKSNAKNKEGAGSNSTTANQATVDQSGSMPRGTQPADMDRKTPGDRSVNSPQTGMADRDRGGNTSATTGTSQWESGSVKTGSWDKGCFISPTTTSFVLVTKDGRQMRLDDASNSMVSQKLSSANRVSEKSKIFRVRVTGDMSGETVHITEIQI